MKPVPEVPPPIETEELPQKLEQRYYKIGMDAVCAQHDDIAGFIKSRRFNDDGLIRGLIVEYVRFAAIRKAKISDSEL